MSALCRCGGLVYGAALAGLANWAHAPVATLVVTSVGLVGLAVNFKKLQHETTIEKIIFVVGAAILVSAAYPLLAPTVPH